MAPAPDYAFYRDEYKGNAPEDSFASQLAGAKAHVDWIIGPNEVTERTALPYKRAVCAAVDAFLVYGNVAYSSLSIGGFSVSGGKSGRDIATEDASRELAATGLLFSGVR